LGAAVEVRVRELRRRRKKIRVEERAERFRVKGSRASELANLRGESLK
jgi:hypothetical protein